MDIAAWMETLFKDIRYSLRQFVRTPVFTIVAVASLAIGIGANTAIFSVMNAAILRALPVRNPRELVMLTNPNASGVSIGVSTGDRPLLSYVEYTTLRDHNTTMSGLIAVESEADTWQLHIAGASPEEAHGRLVTEGYFSVLGVEPAIGRFFTEADAKSPGQDPYAVISYDYWQKRFGGNTSVLNTSIRINKASLTVIGVTPPGFRGETVGDRPDLWVPMLMQPMIMPGRDWLHEQLTADNIAKTMWLHVIGRVKPGVSVARVQTEMDVLFRGILENSYPPAMAQETRKRFMKQNLKVVAASTGAFGGRDEFQQQLLVLLGASAVVLLIACINVANLLLARASARYKEVGVRLSIGASRWRLVRQFLTESLMLSALGGVAGLLLAWGAARLLVIMMKMTTDRDALDLGVALDLRVLAFTAGVTFLTGLIFGLVPAIRGTRVNLNDSLRDSGRGNTTSSGRLNLAKGLVIAQVAFSLLLVVSGGLLLRTLWNLQATDLGYAREKLLVLGVDGVTAGYKDARLTILWNDLADRIRVLPGVRGVTYSQNGLFSGSESGDQVEVEGFTPQKDNERGSRFDVIGPGYFATVGVPILLGREFGLQDSATAPKVCVINEAFQKRFFAGRNPIGLHVTEVFGDQKYPMEVVGVARNVRDHNLRGDVPPRFYHPTGQTMEGPPPGVNFEIRTAGDPQQLALSVRKTVQAVNEDLGLGLARTMTETLDRTTAQPRVMARLCTVFGIIALLLAATGLYGVLSYGVARRTNEIGIRMALGAGRASVVQMILRETSIMIVLGVVIGIGFTVGLTRFIASKLYGLSALDPLTMVTAVLILAMVALVAGYIPAARAAQVNPVTALRHE
ncbi:MAG: ABC transporter permease [Acidobacteriia bacterium]|nr:ABC transporter permease [Terriglobia bacterium]